MTRNRSQLINFVSKFLGTIRFGNDHIAKIMDYEDYQMGNITISRVYYVEGLGHNLFSIGQFCDSDLEHGLVRGLPKLKYQKDHLCSAYALDLGKLKPKDDIRIFFGYAPAKKAFRIYNKRTRMIIETIHVDLDDLTAMASEQFIPTVIAPEPAVSTGTPSSTTIDQDAPSSSTSQTTQETQTLVIPLGVEEADHDIEVEHLDNNPFVEFLIPEPSSEESSTQVVIPNHVHSINQPPEHINKWTKYHPIDNVIGDPSRSVSTRQQLYDEALFCYCDAFLSSVKPKSYKDALTESYWIEAIQE
ncbi:hypothetical protein Tco_1042748 [Tanacetum coccineum]|uniref:Integrase, catalytic region, zinc finger, CCHC-type, peptidase aspartic, catalytic n=1 Tax=Tanacetum coccineum TaxID=301880 RepID=A0ABQ5GKJ4_9ASTR